MTPPMELFPLSSAKADKQSDKKRGTLAWPGSPELPRLQRSAQAAWLGSLLPPSTWISTFLGERWIGSDAETSRTPLS